jgi:serine/threonine protein kinase
MVMDFGIAKALSAAGPETLTQTGMMIGTPAYVSPEQAAGEVNLDGKSDQYSLACVMYEMLTGERPFSGATPQAVMAKRFSEMPKSLRSIRNSIPESVEKAVTKAMAIDRSSVRPGTRIRQSRHSDRYRIASTGSGVCREIRCGAAIHEHERRSGQ